MPDFAPGSALLPLFLVGLLGGAHCAGMCGGIVGALSVGGPARWSLHLAYNAGRIASYTAAGALAGALGSVPGLLAAQLPLRLALYVFASMLLIALGLFLMGQTRALTWLERAGARLVWLRLQPLTARFLPARRATQAFALGLLWGWLPCGLVYSALATALSSGAAGQGALLMLAFGLGTLPNLLLAGLLLVRFRAWVARPAVRVASGLVVASYGVWGLLAAWRLAQMG